MRVLVVGSGGREHALCWGIAKSPLCTKLFCAPGNAGISALAECFPIDADQVDALVAISEEKKIDFVVIGPEVTLALGLADRLREKNIACFGPSQRAAKIESSKGFMKDLAALAKVPTAEFKRFDQADEARLYVQEKGAPIVVKADGLAAGKGVTIAHTVDDALAAIHEMMVKNVFGASGASIVIEEFMEGEEVSFFALCDGKTVIPFTHAQDHKAAYDGDKGPNTGGMGAYSPSPRVDYAMQKRIMDEIVSPTLVAMAEMGRPFTGILFAGLMLTKSGPRLIEYNARFGDPETEVMIPRLKTDLLEVLLASGTGKLDQIKLAWHDQTALCVILAAKGYPGSYQKGTVIRNLDLAGKTPESFIFHAGTAKNKEGDVVANGGRVLGVTAWGETIAVAQARAYQAAVLIDWTDGFYRRDIGWRALATSKVA